MKVTTDSCLFGGWVAEQLSGLEEGKMILDIGSGSGLLSLMLAQKFPGKIDAIELDRGAYEQSLENIASSPYSDRINIYHSDAKTYKARQSYDVIISNPPFYENELRSPDPKRNLAHHGLDLSFSELLSTIQSNLIQSGLFFLLFPYKRKTTLFKLLENYNLQINEVVSVRQDRDHDIMRVMVAGTKEVNTPNIVSEGEIMIKDETDQYSPDFKKLLSDYYLNL